MPKVRNFRYRVEEFDDDGNVIAKHYFCTIDEIAEVYGFQRSTISKYMIYEDGKERKIKFIKLAEPLPAFKNVPLNYDETSDTCETK